MIPTNEYSQSYLRDNSVSSDFSSVVGDVLSSNCSIPPTDIDKSFQQSDKNDYSLLAMKSFGGQIRTEKNHEKDDSGEGNDHSTSSSTLNTIEVIFILPPSILNGTILNQTVSITDTIHNQLITSIIQICANGSSFIIDYSTNVSLPHNVCLYLVLNTTSPISLREIFLCRTIHGNISTTEEETDEDDSSEPSVTFIISQVIIILIMMCLIFIVETARKNHLITRIGRYVFRTRADRSTTETLEGETLNLEAVGERVGNHTVPATIGEQVLAAKDLTSTLQTRRTSNYNLYDVNHLRKQLSSSSNRDIISDRF